MTRVLILCTGNSSRSQMAEGILRALGAGHLEVMSAGTRPSVVRPEAVAAMSEIGIDISGHRSKHVDEFAGQSFDYVITVCDSANDACPIFPNAPTRIHWSVRDPADAGNNASERLDAFRKARETLSRLLVAFRESLPRT